MSLFDCQSSTETIFSAQQHMLAPARLLHGWISQNYFEFSKPEDLCFIYSICTPAEIELRTFCTKYLTPGGNNYSNDFPGNQLSKFMAV